jgi:hypothetical protein
MAKKISKVIQYLFTTTNGLILMAIAIIGLIAAIWGTLSGPMVEWGVRDITVKVLKMDLQHAEREGRLVMLYHSIAMAVTAIIVYLLTDVVEMKRRHVLWSRTLVTVGYLTAVFSGLGFAYFGHNYTLHGLFLFGLSLIFFSGCILAVGLWPWNKEFYLSKDSELGHTRKGFSYERLAFWSVVMATLGSAALGAWSGSYTGNGFEIFLAEDTIRAPFKPPLKNAIVGHLHIMLALMGIAVTLIIGRWLDFKGFWHKLAMPSMIIGTIVLTLGAWSVVVTEHAHTIIYVGAVFALCGGLFLVIYGLPKITKERLLEQGLEGKAGFGKTLKALLHDPLKFGVLWQMIFMNFTTSFVGIFMAVKLEDIFRVWNHREERIELAGHWHILATIIAIMILFYYADRIGLKGKIRQWFGWIIIIGSDIAFASVTVFEMKRLFISEYNQQPLVNKLMALTDIGLGAVLIMLAAFLVWRLIALFKPDRLEKQHLTGKTLRAAEQESLPKEVSV